MMVIREAAMSRDVEKPRSRAALVAWPIVITLIAAMLLGGFVGYNQTVVNNGGTPLPAWAGPLAALGFVTLALVAYARRYRLTWQSLSPRKRRYWLTLGLCAVIGGVIGAWMAIDQRIGEQDSTGLLTGPLSPNFSIAASLVWTLGLAAAMWIYHRSIDDHEERAWLWACVAGWYAFIFPAPVWWVLHRADMAPPVDAMLLFFLSLIVNAIVWAWLKFR